MKCAVSTCGKPFKPRAPHQVYCSPQCRRTAQNQHRVARERAKAPGAVRSNCALKTCRREFWRTTKARKYCSEKCQVTAHRTEGLTDEFRRPRKRLRCGRCGGRHMAANCKTAGTKAVRQYGTMDPETRAYVPPPGVAVRVVWITPFVHSDRLAKMLHELDGGER